MPMVRSFKELNVWQNSIELAVLVFEHSKSFPSDERFSLTDQVRRASRSIASNISEGWRKRRYVAVFISKLNDSEGEAAEVQTCTEIVRRCGYWPDALASDFDQRCEHILAQLVKMIDEADRWCL